VRSSHIPDREAALQRWWQEALGKALLSAESELLTEALEDVFGWELLQIGAWGDGRELLVGSRTRRQTLIAARRFEHGPDVIARASQLPIVSDSIDAALLPHTLEFAADPYSIVREVDRVLVAEGQLIVMGFRPWSLGGLRARASRNGFPPSMRRVLSQGRVQEWLELLGYEVVAHRHYLYASPWSRPAASEAAGTALRRGLVNPMPAGAYLLKARKRVYTLTPVRLRFREKARVIGSLVKPTSRSHP
jgi:SAM-dependent methyltransferase